MYSYEEIENQVITRLQQKLPANSCDVIPLPDKESDYKDVINKPRITVAFGGSDFQTSRSTNDNSQSETLSLVCNIQWKYLRGENGVYFWIEEVKKIIAGWRPDKGSRYSLKSVDFEERDVSTKIWNYNVTFAMTKPFVQSEQDDADITYPLLQEINLIDKVQTP